MRMGIRRSAFVALITVAASAVSVSGQTVGDLKALYPRTEVAVNGETRAVIVAPDQGPIHAVARRLRSALEQAGAGGIEVVGVDDVISPQWEIDFARIGGRTIIAPGNINTNRLLAKLWGQGYVVADSIFPDEGGYVVRTVHDPFARGINVIALAGSDPAGVQRAVDVFVDRYVPDDGDVVLPEPVVDIKFTNTQRRFYPYVDHWLSSKRQPQHTTMEWFRQYLRDRGMMDENAQVIGRQNGTLVDVTQTIGRLAESWIWTGNPDLPPLMKQVLDANRHLLANPPPVKGMSGRSAGDVKWWDLVEELPVWTDQDRLDVTNALYRDALQGWERRAANEMVDDGYVQIVDENHGTNAAGAALAAWHYFEKYYDLPETDYWMRLARAVYLGQCASHQVLEDAATYLVYCPEDAMRQGLKLGDLRYFELGIARGHAEFIAQCCVNNLGLCTGFGDAPLLVHPGAFETLAPAAWYYRDPRLNWIIREHLLQSHGLRIFQSALPIDLTVEAERPTEWTGICRFPIFKQTLKKGDGSREFITDPRESVGDEWFNKIVFREGWDRDDQYLLLDGAGKWTNHQHEGYPNVGPSGHKHDDVNTIINFTDNGRMWLVDHTYGEAKTISGHSGLYITCNGAVSYDAHECRIEDLVETPWGGICRTLDTSFGNADWERTIFWTRGEDFLVIDRVTALEPGHYVARCSFWGLGEHELREGALRLKQNGELCDILSDGRGSLDVEEFRFPGQSDWDSFYPHAEGVAKIFQQDKSAVLEPGGQLTFANLIAAKPQAALDATELLPVAQEAVIVYRGETPTLCGVGALPGIQSDVGGYLISANRTLLAGVTALRSADLEITADTPVDLQIAADGLVEATAREPATLRVNGSEIRLTEGRNTVGGEALGEGLGRLTELALARAERIAPEYAAGREGAEKAETTGLAVTERDLKTPVAAAEPADLDGDGRPEWLVAGKDGATAFSADGTMLWRFPTDQPCRAIDAGDLNGDGTTEVALGCDDTRAYVLDASGDELWSHECTGSTASLAGPPMVDMVRIADLDGDGTAELVVGSNWVHCLDADGNLLWERYLRMARGQTCGEFRGGAVADIDTDGDLEVVAPFLYSYHSMLVLDHAGEVVLPVDWDNDDNWYMGVPSPEQSITVDLLGRGAGRHIAVAGAAESGLQIRWGFGEYAGEMAASRKGNFVAIAADESVSPPILCAANNMGTVFGYRAGGQDGARLDLNTVWTRVIGEKITAMASLDVGGDDRPELLAGTKSGALHVLETQSGEPLAMLAAVDSPVRQILPAGDGVLVVHGDGAVRKIRMTE